VKRILISAAAGLLAISLAACSSQDDSSGTDVDESGVAAAKAVVEERSTAPEASELNLEPLTKLPTGAVVDYMECAVIQCTDVGDQLDKIAPELGVKLNRIQTGGTPEEISAAFDRAVNDKPAAVLVPAIPSSLWSKQLAALEKQGTHVIVWTTPDEPGNGIDKVFLDSAAYTANGELMADWVIADSDGAAKSVFIQIAAFPVLETMEKAYAAHLEKQCPACSYENVTVQGTDIGKNLPSRVVSYLQSKPDTDYVVISFGGMVLGVPEALKAAGLSDKVKVVSQAGLNLNFNYIKDGGQAVDLTLSHLNLAYAALDAAARAINGQSLDELPASLPGIFLTQDNLDFSPEENTTWPMDEELENQYKTAWGVG